MMKRQWGNVRAHRAMMLVVLVLAFNAEVRADSRLWDREPALWDVAKTYTLKRPLPADFGIEGPTMPRGAKGEGINLSNGELKLSLWGPCSNLTISASKTDIWNRFDPKLPYKKPETKQERTAAFWNKPFPKPAGRLMLLAEDFGGAPQPEVSTEIRNGLNTFTIRNGKAVGEFKYVVSRSDSNIIALSATFSGVTNPVFLRIQRSFIKEGFGGAGNDGTFFWVHHQLPVDKTFPKGFDFYLVGKVAGVPVTLTSTNLVGGGPVGANPGPGSTARLTVNDGQTVLAYATIVTAAEAADPLAEAKKNLLAAEARGFGAIVEENEKWFQALYERRERGRIFTGEWSSPLKDVLLPFFFMGSWQNRHTYGSLPDPMKFEGDASYADLEAERVRWGALLCFNEELYVQDFVAGRNEGIGPYYTKLVNFWRKAWERHAADNGYKGMYYIRGYVPVTVPEVYYSWDTDSMTKNDWCSMCWSYKMVWDEYDYGGHDEAYLRESVYPGLRNLADFFGSLVKLGTNGCYHIEDSLSRENYPGQDAQDCIASAKWFWKTAIQAASLLKTDGEKRKEWQHYLDKIQPYYRMPDGTYADVVQNGVLKQNTWTQHFPINVTGEFNLDLSHEERERAFRSCKGVGVLNADTGHLLAMNPDHWAGDCGFGRYPWMMYYARKYFPSFTNTVDTVTNLTPLVTSQEKTMACWFEPERLCNSRSGTIYLFPCVPSKFNVAFKDMQARGGFLVSSEWKSGAVTYASIKARRSGECKVMNPWPGKGMKAIELPGRTAVKTVKDADAERYRFTAEAGREYEFECR